MRDTRSPATAAALTVLTNADIGAHLRTLAQLLAAKGENQFKVRAYRRAAETVESTPDSVAELARNEADLTTLPNVGRGIAGAIRAFVETGGSRQLEELRADVGPEIAALSEYPALDAKTVLRVYQKLGIGSVAELKQRLEQGDIAAQLGPRIEQHVRRALQPSDEILLFDADPIADTLSRFLRQKCGARRVAIAGDVRRRAPTVRDIEVVIATTDFAAVVERFRGFGGRAEVESARPHRAEFRLATGRRVVLEHGRPAKWGLDLLLATGSPQHLAALEAQGGPLAALAEARASYKTEPAVYRKLGLSYIPPELREGEGEVERAQRARLPRLVTVKDIRGELHAHTTASDGAHSIAEMAAAAKARGYSYCGVSDHSQSLKIAGGVSPEALWQQIRAIDRLNEKLRGIRVLKSAEVDILADGALDYPDELLRELDYTICSIHSRFALGKAAQTDRILRAMDNPYFTILGHATGRLLLRRPGYELDFDRIVAHARERGCFFEINASPDRLDLSAAHARLARDAGIKIAICTDAHSAAELDFVRCGVDQARRAGLTREDILNTQPWPRLSRLLRARR